MGKLQPLHEVLRYTEEEPDRAKIRRYYRAWRKVQGLPVRCDEPDCIFHTQPMVWRSKPLLPILDHKDGCSRNNHPGNLRYLCPNCNEQLAETKGGANAGRILHVGPDGYAVLGDGADREVKAFEQGQGSDAAAR